MGYRGKLDLQERARELRADGWTMPDIAAELCVARSSVSLWTRDVPFAAQPRRPPRAPRSNRFHDAKIAEIEGFHRAGVERIAELTDREFLMAGLTLYAGEGAKTDGCVKFSNSDAAMVAFFCAWLRRFFVIDESRLRVQLYLHEGLDVDAAIEFWSGTAGIPQTQFGKPYRAIPDAGIRHNKHEHGCVGVRYSSAPCHRELMGLIRALLSSDSYSGVAQSAEHAAVNRVVESSSLSPGASRFDFGLIEAPSDTVGR